MQIFNNVPKHIQVSAREMDIEAMENDFTYLMAQKLTFKLYDEGLISKCEYDKISKLNKEKFCPFLREIL